MPMLINYKVKRSKIDKKETFTDKKGLTAECRLKKLYQTK